MCIQKTFLAFILFTAFTGCSSVPKTYHIWAGARTDLYSETESSPIDQQLASVIGGTVTTTSGNPSKISSTGYGGQLGFTEEVGKLVTTISMFYTKYGPVSYTFNSSLYGSIQETMDISGYGVDATLGWNIGIFRPGIGYKYERQTYKATVSRSASTTSTSTSSTIFMIGPALALDFPLGGTAHFVVQGDYRVPVSKSSALASANSILIQAGIRIGGFEVK